MKHRGYVRRRQGARIAAASSFCPAAPAARPPPTMKPVPPPRRPLLSQASRPLTVTIPALNEAGETVPNEIAAVQVDWEVEAAAVTTRHGLKDADQRLGSRTVTTGCGQGTVFGGLLD